MKIKGVNLGNWLVLEKWMSDVLFHGISAQDEEDFYHTLSAEEAQTRLRMHRDYFIQERDFQQIASFGLNAVRIPVPHYIFGGKPPYIGCIEYLDRAFRWAEQYGLLVLIDIHTVPDSQNGFDNGGLTGVVKWHHKPENITAIVELAGQLAKRYAHSPALYGIELLNEPISEKMLEFTKGRYHPTDPQRAEGSDFIPTDVLKDFYQRGYEAIRKYSPTAKVVLHDGFRLNEWHDFMVGSAWHDVVLDTHCYLAFQEPEMPARQMADYARTIQEKFRTALRQASQTHDVIVGEWCLANKSKGLSAMTPEQKKWVYRIIADLQLQAWDDTAGWFFWSYKLHAPGRNDWDICRAIQAGWLRL